MDRKLRVAVFVSGSGSNLQSLIDASAAEDYPAEIVLVISSSKRAYGLERAAAAGIEGSAIRRKDFDTGGAFSDALLEALRSQNADIVCLAGYLKLIPSKIVGVYRNRILNIHPALLPKFGGKGMYGMNVHRAVIESGERTSGPTVHIVDEIYDNGQIVMQEEVAIEPGETPASLQKKVLAKEHQIYPVALRRVAEEILKCER